VIDVLINREDRVIDVLNIGESYPFFPITALCEQGVASVEDFINWRMIE
jgi:hypothetical protein